MSLESDHQPGAEQRKVYLDWQNFGNGLEVLRNQIIDSKKEIYWNLCNTRGGLMIGVIYLIILGIPMLDQL
jgi:hypoxanthine phosphoribosyltransferase